MAEDIDGHLRLVVTPSVSGTTCAWLVQVYSNSFGWSDAQQLNISGAASGAFPYTASAPSSSNALLYQTTVYASGPRGTSLAISASVSGAYEGSAPSLSNVSQAIPAIAPSAPPGVLAFASPTAVQVAITAGVATANGAAIDKYEFRAALDAGFATGVVTQEDSDGSPNVHTQTGLTAGTLMYFQARAHNSVGWGDYCATASYRLLPGACTALAASLITPTSARFDWSAPSGGTPDGYRIQVSTSVSFSTLLINVDVGTARTYTATGLSPVTRYYVRVLAYNATGNGDWATMPYFDTIAGQWAYVTSTFVQVIAVKRWTGSTWQTLTVRKRVGGAWQQ